MELSIYDFALGSVIVGDILYNWPVLNKPWTEVSVLFMDS